MPDRPQRPPEPSPSEPEDQMQAVAWIRECLAFSDFETKRADEAEARLKNGAAKWDALLEAKNRLLDEYGTARVDLANTREEAARKIEEWHSRPPDTDDCAWHLTACQDSSCTCLANAALVRQP